MVDNQLKIYVLHQSARYIDPPGIAAACFSHQQQSVWHAGSLVQFPNDLFHITSVVQVLPNDHTNEMLNVVLDLEFIRIVDPNDQEAKEMKMHHLMLIPAKYVLSVAIKRAYHEAIQ